MSRQKNVLPRNKFIKEGANKQVISSQADSLIKISRIWADFFPANTSNQPI
ncbi:ABC transporter [Klebsiella pneumoniae]|nr:ABC transporter [Klebsiella pneumoniae]